MLSLSVVSKLTINYFFSDKSRFLYVVRFKVVQCISFHHIKNVRYVSNDSVMNQIVVL